MKRSIRWILLLALIQLAVTVWSCVVVKVIDSEVRLLRRAEEMAR